MAGVASGARFPGPHDERLPAVQSDGGHDLLRDERPRISHLRGAHREDLPREVRGDGPGVQGQRRAVGARSPGCVGKVPAGSRAPTGPSRTSTSTSARSAISTSSWLRRKRSASPTCSGRCSRPGSRRVRNTVRTTRLRQDGVHPGWAGQTVMAYAFLKALGVDGDIAR